MSFVPILCVDFDGVLHSYTSKWQGAAVIPDPPVPGALDWLRRASAVFDVRVYSSRSSQQGGCDAMRAWLQRHAREAFGDEGEVERLLQRITFCHEKPQAFLTIDDRAICFEGDWSKLDPRKLRDFKPWNRR